MPGPRFFLAMLDATPHRCNRRHVGDVHWVLSRHRRLPSGNAGCAEVTHTRQVPTPACARIAMPLAPLVVEASTHLTVTHFARTSCGDRADRANSVARGSPSRSTGSQPSADTGITPQPGKHRAHRRRHQPPDCEDLCGPDVLPPLVNRVGYRRHAKIHPMAASISPSQPILT